MRRIIAVVLVRPAGSVGFWLAMLVACSSIGQDDRPRDHVRLPPRWGSGATPLSTVISAQAEYVQALGDFHESLAIAREVNAKAVAVEIENSVKAVEAYWERKRIWEEEYKKRNPNPEEREKRLQEAFKRQIRDDYDRILRTDPADRLNWLLTQLSGPALAAQYLSKEQLAADGELNVKLLPRDKEQIWLTDGGKGGAKLEFNLVESKPLDTSYWPLGLRAPEFEIARKQFEQCRENVLKEIRQSKGQLSHQSGQDLITATNDLFAAVEAAYPAERRKTPSEFIDYNDSKNFLKSLLAGVLRTLKTSDRSIFEGNLQFQGETLLDLVQYMYQNGLKFAKAHPGGEGTYGKLFLGMRSMYVVLGVDKTAQAGDNNKAGGGARRAQGNPF